MKLASFLTCLGLASLAMTASAEPATTKWSAKWIAARDAPMNPPKGASYLPAANPPGRFTSAVANPLGYHAVIASNAVTMKWV